MSQTSTYLTAGIVVALVVGALGGYFVGASQHPTEAMMQTETMTEVMTMSPSATAMMQQDAIPFTPQPGQMMHGAWLLIAPTGNGQYALSVYVSGLEPSMGTGNDYVIDGPQMTGSMAAVPVTGNLTSSEFEVGSDGVGYFFALLNQNPYTTFESIQIFFLPGMQMSNAMLVATASFSMSSTSTSSM